MPDLTPITREEMFLDGNTELTPITREEKILAGEDIDVITRREWFLKKYRSGGDITVEPITITENGTTTAPSGKAYSPIYTNVPLPENAYLLKDFENVPSDIVTFNDGSALPMPSLKTTIVPIQDLHGYDGPWVGGSGKNKFPDNVDNTGSSYGCESVFTGNKLTLTGTSTGNGGRLSLKTKNFSLKAGTYYLKSFYQNTHSKATPAVFLQIGTDNVLVADAGTYTLEADTTVATLGVNVANGQQYDFEATYALYTTNENTYYPYSNICPISGWSGANVSVCGVNQFNKNATFVNAYCDYNTKIVSNNDMRSAIIPIKSGISYKIIVGGLNQGMKRYGYTKDIPQIGDTLYNSNGVAGIEEYNDGDVITVPNGFNYLFITFYRYNVATDSFDDVKNAFGINYPSTDTSYHAYNGHTYNIQFTDSQGNPIEVFGGECDVVNGSLDENQFCYKVTSDTIITKSGDYFEINNVLDDDATANYEFLSSFCKRTTASLSNMSDNEGRFVTSRRYLAVKLPYSTVEEVKTYLTSINAQIVYTLPTSTTLQQQPTSIKSIEGTNNVWGDCGQIKEGSYFAKSEEE